MEHCAELRNALTESLVAPLFVPGDRPGQIQKARARGAQAVVIDLEDAVAPSAKPSARLATTEALATPVGGIVQLVRVNAVRNDTDVAADLEALTPVLGAVHGIVVPKVESANELNQFEQLLRAVTGEQRPVLATVESALGIRNAWDIAMSSASLHTLLFGSVDLSAELDVATSPEGHALHAARSTIVLACAAAGLASPLDGPYPQLDDERGVSTATRAAQELGFGGKIAIHPDQLPLITETFLPDPSSLDWAAEALFVYEQAVAEHSGVARTKDGTFVDVPVARRARAMLQRARAHRAVPNQEGTSNE